LRYRIFLLPLVAHTKKQIKTNNINIMSIKSPKNKYSAVITLDKACKEIGSQVTFTNNDINELKKIVKDQCDCVKCGCTVAISQNMKEYPQFDWVEIEKYRIEQ